MRGQENSKSHPDSRESGCNLVWIARFNNTRDLRISSRGPRRATSCPATMLTPVQFGFFQATSALFVGSAGPGSEQRNESVAQEREQAAFVA
jgi:hypothetical protein